MSFIEFHNVTKKYGSFEAIRGINLKIERGEMVALLGPNGAGKSTLIQLLLGLKTATTGTVQISGKPVGGAQNLKKMGVTPQDLSFSPYLKTSEILNWVARIYGKKLESSFITQFGLDEFISQLAGGLSGGQRRRLGLALAFVGDPEIVILDEPTTGLDVEGKVQMWEYLEKYSRLGGTVILTTHDLYELSRLHCRMLLIDQGQLIREGNVHEIISRCEYKRVSFRTSQTIDLITEAKVEKNSDHIVCWTLHAEALMHELVTKNIQFSDLQVQIGNIDQVFRLMRSGS